MTKKERTIKAFEELAHKYRNPEGLGFFTNSCCPLCHVHLQREANSCVGCPLASVLSSLGCTNFRTEINAYSKFADKKHILRNGGPCKEFIKRAEFFEKYLPVIKKWPDSRFTIKGWKHSGDEISRED